MSTLEFSTRIDASAEALFDWHDRPGAFERLVPPWAPVRLERFEGIREGDRAVIRIGPGPLALRWVAEHTDVVEGRQFCDRQVRGPFAHWEHRHRFEPVEGGASRLVDRIEYALPGGPLGRALGPAFVEPELRRQFAYRHRTTRRDLARHRHYNPEGRSLTVAVSGASGLIGSSLTAFLTTGGHRVRPLVRSAPASEAAIGWAPREGRVEAEKLEGVDAVVHLAGEPILGVWTPEKRQRIYTSRAEGTRLLAETLAGLDDPPDVFVSASGVGVYGDHGQAPIGEDAEPQDAGFLGEVCQAWEAAARPAASAGIRTVQVRLGVVLTPAGGALRLMLPAFWAGLGGRLGDPDQYVSWVGIDDVLGAIYHAIWTDALEGPVNVTAPNPATAQELADTLAATLNRPALLNLPAALVRAVGGEAADEMLLTSARVRPERLEASGYRFADPGLDGALAHILGRAGGRTGRRSSDTDESRTRREHRPTGT
jgi:hypothetical protein